MKSRIYLLALATCLVALCFGCNYVQRRMNRPSQTVKEFYKHLESGNADEAAKLFSKKFGKFDDMNGFRDFVAKDSESIKEAGGLELLRVDKERIEGEI